MAVITVGNFDGVHIGHLRLINRVREIAKRRGEKSIAVTFSKNSKSVLSGGVIKTLINKETKERMLLDAGIDEVAFVDFEKFSELSGEEFLKYLKKELSLSVFVSGEDFRFGKNASCGVNFLKEKAVEMGFSVDIVFFAEKDKISSSSIRSLIERGEVEKAAKLLGYRYFIEGNALGGKHLGRKLGFPTINIYPDANVVFPKYGVYASDIEVGGVRYTAVSNAGVRPTVEKTDKANIETYILNNSVSVSGGRVVVFFKKFIRPEKKFDSPEDLSSRIAIDCQIAEKIV